MNGDAPPPTVQRRDQLVRRTEADTTSWHRDDGGRRGELLGALRANMRFLGSADAYLSI